MTPSHGESLPATPTGVDAICEAFEAAWLAGQAPRIEEFLQRGDSVHQPELLRELLMAEWDLRRRHEQHIDIAPYIERFPTNRQAITDWWSVWQEKLPGSVPDHGPTIAFVPPKDSAFSEAPGTVIDRFKLLEKLGEGGFGTVWAAEQREPVKRRVALKIIKLGMDTRAVVARFEAERQALALMDHANIARVFDAGSTETGRPYFVMELVRGIPITEYCDRERLTTQVRLDLFIKVCHAIQHAHQKGIIHRDIKPSNILVTLHDGVPVPKVIDFGIAKAIQQDLTEKTIYTQLAQFIGTPAYMSPEQAEMSGLDIDTRSDIYSLGVLLYELLTGATPFDAKELVRSGLDELRRIIREKEPLTPSTRLTKDLQAAKKSGTTNPALLGTLRMPYSAIDRDLDWVVMKCLEKDRTRRYETANGLAGDVGRYLRDEPVEACPPSAAYRFRKFARRQKTGLVIATVLTLALLLVLGVVAGSIGWAVRDRATRQAAIEVEVDLALKEAARLQAQRNYAEALSAALRAEALLSAGSGQELQKRVRDLRKDLQMVLRLESIPLEGSRSTSEGQFDFANEDREYGEAFRQFGMDAIVLSPQEIADHISATTIRLELASELDAWAFTRGLVRPQGDEIAKKLVAAARVADPDGLRNRIRDALEIRDAKALSDLLTAESSQILQWPTTRLYYLALFQLQQFEQLMTLSRRLHRQRPDDFWNNYTLASLHASKDPPQWEDAARFYTAALSLQPENAATQNELARLLVNWPRPGVDHFEEAIDLAKKAVKATPTAGNYWITLGIAHYRAAQWSDALTAFQQAAKLRDGGDGLNWLFLAMAHGRLGEKELGRKWYDQGVQWMEKNNSDDDGLKSMRAEAAELLGIKDGAPSANWLKQLIKRGLAQ
jgi:tetratricopeptide (TPR) repeat protein/tRNA A-37 threonylcarbamoyl transferase component Bud32